MAYEVVFVPFFSQNQRLSGLSASNNRRGKRFQVHDSALTEAKNYPKCRWKEHESIYIYVNYVVGVGQRFFFFLRGEESFIHCSES
jgi:hypothetical protein